MNYKGFKGSINYCKIDSVFWGKIENINDLITFEGKNLSELYKEFIVSTEDYLKALNKLNHE